MSGGPLHASYSGGWYVFGVAITQAPDCWGSCSSSTPNTMRRVTNEWLSHMSVFMGY